MTLRQLALHRIMVHHNYPQIICGCLSEHSAETVDLMLAHCADDREVAQPPRQGSWNHPMRCVEPSEGDAGNMQHWLDVLADVPAIVRQHLVIIAEGEGRLPPHDVVIPRNDDDLARHLHVADEGPCALEFAGVRALRKVA